MGKTKAETAAVTEQPEQVEVEAVAVEQDEQATATATVTETEQPEQVESITSKRKLRIVSDALESYIYNNLRDPETADERERKRVLLETVAQMAEFAHATDKDDEGL